MWWQKYMAASLQDMPVQYPTPMCGLLIPFLLILIQVSSCTVTVTGYIGQDVTLPCSYDVQANGVLSFCWGHGQVPRSKCSNTILLSDNGNVTFRESPRVEIPGWFNDQKINVHLTMEEAPMEELDIQSSTDCDTVTVSKALLEAENIGRIAVIFFLTIILILILIIRRKVLMGRTTPQKLNTITAENIYETIPMTK
ncbi:T-cell immunoglobulin and mucin domain-containing protein 4-like isoform X3 [Xiphophorus maculatus]|uniref:T-cell immunoglobulin and mucin domain-containing protein 4-like isoform X3 n=1 Tax=Xiphophorus maculatus TaxID=8083 RepID=UPI000C6E8818|nr:T-cell immunoglobulin and mucin domain-containing protein 4-like isoform X3 [Xiphophorus maculatus]